MKFHVSLKKFINKLFYNKKDKSETLRKQSLQTMKHILRDKPKNIVNMHVFEMTVELQK